MHRLLILALSAIVCWGAATACSGGGGSTSSPGTTTSPASTVAGGEGTVSGGSTVSSGSDATGTSGANPLSGSTAQAVIPEMSVSGVLDGGIYGTESLTADASASKNATSFEWTLNGKNLATPTHSSGASFAFNLPSNDSTSIIQYSLLVKITSKDGHTSEQTILLNSAAKPIAKISTNLSKPGAVWPTNQMLPLGGSTSQNFTKLNWKVQKKIGDQISDADFIVNDSGQGIYVKPTVTGAAYTITLVAEGKGGKSDPVSIDFVTADIPQSVVSSATVKDGGVAALGQMTFSGSALNTDGNAADVSKYEWTATDPNGDVVDSKSGVDAIFSFATKMLGTYTVKLQTYAGDDSSIVGNPAILSFGTAASPKPVISGLPENKIEAVGYEVNLSSAQSGDLGLKPAYEWNLTDPNGGVQKFSTADIAFTPSLAGQYGISLKITNSQTQQNDQVASTFTVKSVPVAKISSSILPWHSYMMAPLTASSSGTSNDATGFSWTLQNLDGALDFASTKPEITFTPKSYGLNLLGLMPLNGDITGQSAQIPFNVRAPSIVELYHGTPFGDSLLVIGANDIYVGNTFNYHYGSDKRWSRFMDKQCGAAVTSIFARSSNEVYFAGSDYICRYTAAKGEEAINAAVLGSNMRQITGDTSTLYVVTQDKKLFKSTNNANSWTNTNATTAVHLVKSVEGELVQATGPTNKFVAQYLSLLVGSNSAGGLFTTGEWSAIEASDLAHVYATTTTGEICIYNGAAIDCSLKLPVEIEYGTPIQQYAISVNLNSDGTLELVSQDGGIYVLDNGKIVTLHSPHDDINTNQFFKASANTSGVYALHNDSKTLWKFDFGTNKWVDAMAYPSYSTIGLAAAGAQFVGDTLYLYNVKDVNNTSILQQLSPEGDMLPLTLGDNNITSIQAVWGPSYVHNVAYFLSDAGLMLYANNATMLRNDTAFFCKLPGEVLVDIGGSGNSLSDFYVLTNDRLYHTQDNTNTFTTEGFGSPNGGYQSLYVTQGGDIYVGANDGTIMSKKSGGAWTTDPIVQGAQGKVKVRGSSDGGLFATVNEQDLYQFKNGQWIKLTIPPELVVGAISELAVASSDEVWTFQFGKLVLHYKAGAFSVPWSDFIVFIATNGQQTYFGGGINGNFDFYQYGPLQ